MLAGEIFKNSWFVFPKKCDLCEKRIKWAEKYWYVVRMNGKTNNYCVYCLPTRNDVVERVGKPMMPRPASPPSAQPPAKIGPYGPTVEEIKQRNPFADKETTGNQAFILSDAVERLNRVLKWKDPFIWSYVVNHDVNSRGHYYIIWRCTKELTAELRLKAHFEITMRELEKAIKGEENHIMEFPKENQGGSDEVR